MDKAMVYLAVAAGSALGGMARYWLSGLTARWLGESFPWGTIMVNISGSLVIGFFAAVTGPDGRWMAGLRLNPFFATGVCGGYTTFSSFSLQTLRLAQQGQWLHAAGNLLGSVILCMVAVWLGHALGQASNR